MMFGGLDDATRNRSQHLYSHKRWIHVSLFDVLSYEFLIVSYVAKGVRLSKHEIERLRPSEIGKQKQTMTYAKSFLHKQPMNLLADIVIV